MSKKVSQKPTKNARGGKTRVAAGASRRAPTPVAKKKVRPPAASPKPETAARAKRTETRSTKAAVAPSRPQGRDKARRKLNHPAPVFVEAARTAGMEIKAERALTNAEIAEFRQMLLYKRAEILGDVSTLHNEALDKDRRDAAGDLSSMPIHMADLGSDNYELEFTLGLIEGERAILKEIDEALERIRQGTYGLCLATGKPIGKARLRAKPWAKYCYEYTLAQEQGQTRRV